MGVSRFLCYAAKAKAQTLRRRRHASSFMRRGVGDGMMFWGLARASWHARTSSAREAERGAVLCYQAISRVRRTKQSICYLGRIRGGGGGGGR